MNKKTLVLGASLNSNKYSNMAINRIVDKKHSVRAIGGEDGEVRGVQIHSSKKIFQNIDTVTLYLNKNNQMDFYDYILDLNPRRVIFNPGSENAELENLLLKNSIFYEKACTLVLLGINKY